MGYKALGVIMFVCIVALFPLACGPAQYTLNTVVIPEGTGTITPAGGKYDAGTEVTLVAEPAFGYAFDHWWGGGIAGTYPSVIVTNPSVIVTIDSNKCVSAFFEKQQYTLTTLVSPVDTGTISPSTGSYDAGYTVELIAHSDYVFVFDHWSGDATGTSNPAYIYMDGDKYIIAHFKKRLSLSPVCKGIGVPEAAAYQGSKHPVVLLNSDGYEHWWSDWLPIEWRPAKEEETQLVACVGEEKEEVLETCFYDATPPFDIVKRCQYSLHVTLREAKTGQIVASTTLRGSKPRACGQTEYYHVSTVEGSHITLSEVQTWLQRYVAP